MLAFERRATITGLLLIHLARWQPATRVFGALAGVVGDDACCDIISYAGIEAPICVLEARILLEGKLTQ